MRRRRPRPACSAASRPGRRRSGRRPSPRAPALRSLRRIVDEGVERHRRRARRASACVPSSKVSSSRAPRRSRPSGWRRPARRRRGCASVCAGAPERLALQARDRADLRVGGQRRPRGERDEARRAGKQQEPCAASKNSNRPASLLHDSGARAVNRSHGARPHHDGDTRRCGQSRFIATAAIERRSRRMPGTLPRLPPHPSHASNRRTSRARTIDCGRNRS